MFFVQSGFGRGGHRSRPAAQRGQRRDGGTREASNKVESKDQIFVQGIELSVNIKNGFYVGRSFVLNHLLQACALDFMWLFKN